MRGLSFTTGGELYAVDVTLVQKVARKLAITPVPSAPPEVLGIANLKGRVVTVLSLNKLLGLDEAYDSERCINTIVFKSGSSSEDQMGLAIEKPGNLIDLSDKAIKSPHLANDPDEGFCISGIAEIDDEFYRIIDLNIIMQRYIAGTETITANVIYGGDEND